MYIERIELKNYRGHEHLELRFQRGMTVIAGVNGAGKTSLLLGLQDALTYAVPFFPNGHWQAPFNDARFAHVKVVAPHGRIRIEEQYPVAVLVEGRVFDSAVNWSIHASRIGVHNAAGTHPTRLLEHRVSSGVPGSVHEDMLSLPIVMFYRASRAWRTSEVNAIAAAIERSARRDGYMQWWDAGHSAEDLQQWIVAKSLERLQVASETGQSFSSIESDELGLISAALRRVIESFEGIHYDFQTKEILVDWCAEDGAAREPVAFEYLSDGQRAVISLVADIVRRMSLLNPHLGMDVTDETEGIVLVDELDMHLHPEWQRALTRGLTKAFPKVQFIVASHSPQVIGELPHENVILLTPDGPVNPQGSFGMTSNQVLQELMDAEVQATPVKRKLDEIGEALTRNQLDEAEEKIRDLAAEAPELRELASAQALLKRKRTIGR